MSEIESREKIFSVKHLKKYYQVNKSLQLEKIKYVHAVDDVSFEVYEGEIFGVVGESGSGKSTIGRCILKLIDITEGEIQFKGEDISNFKFNQMKPYRKEMQMVFQNPLSSFNPKKTIGGALSEIGKVYKMSKIETDNRIQELLDLIKLPSDVLYRSPGELSGGQLQRLAIARALILNPAFVMADEPVSALDVSVQSQILNLFMDLRDKLGVTMMFVSHDLNVVRYVCDNVAVMYLGKIVEMAPVDQLFSNTLHPYTQALISAKPISHPLETKERIILEGDVPNAIDVPKGCRFASRCKLFKSGVCDQADPPMEEHSPGHFVACHVINY